MTALPPKANLTGSAVTQGQFKTALDTVNDYLTGLRGADGTPATARAALYHLYHLPHHLYHLPHLSFIIHLPHPSLTSLCDT